MLAELRVDDICSHWLSFYYHEPDKELIYHFSKPKVNFFKTFTIAIRYLIICITSNTRINHHKEKIAKTTLPWTTKYASVLMQICLCQQKLVISNQMSNDKSFNETPKTIHCRYMIPIFWAWPLDNDKS